MLHLCGSLPDAELENYQQERSMLSPRNQMCIKTIIQLPSSKMYLLYKYFKSPMGDKVPMVSATTSEEVLVKNILGVSDYYQVFASSIGDLSRDPATTSQRCPVGSSGFTFLSVIQICSSQCRFSRNAPELERVHRTTVFFFYQSIKATIKHGRNS